MSTTKMYDRWPCERQNFVIKFFSSPNETTLLFCTQEAGVYFFTETFSGVKLQFETTDAQPCRAVVLPNNISYDWQLAKEEKVVLSGQCLQQTQNTRMVFWSCNQVCYKKGTAFDPEKIEILQWYRKKLKQFDPFLVAGIGDIIYCDNKNGVNFISAVREAPENYDSDRIFQLYTEAYMRQLCAEPLKKTLASYSHIFMYDDHELYDGYGSEKKTDERDRHIYLAGRKAAKMFLFDSSPCCRTEGDSHQKLSFCKTEMFVLDSRTSRRYGERVISASQLADFALYLTTALEKDISMLLIISAVPVVYLRPGWEREIAEIPDFLQKLSGVRDDVRDQWGSPENAKQMKKILRLLQQFHTKKPGVKIVFVSGDIHIANSFTFQPKGFSSPLYQITSSALTNDHHAPKIVRELAGLPFGPYYHGSLFGMVERLWPDVPKNNFLSLEIKEDGADFVLHVYNGEQRRIFIKF